MEDPKLGQLKDRRAYYQEELENEKLNGDEQRINSAEVMVENMQKQIDKLSGKRKTEPKISQKGDVNEGIDESQGETDALVTKIQKKTENCGRQKNLCTTSRISTIPRPVRK